MNPYSSEFLELVNNAYQKSEKLIPEDKEFGNPFYIGFGNPNSEIIIFGKEKGFKVDKNCKKSVEKLEHESLQNPNEWKYYIDNSITINTEKFYESGYYQNAFFPYLNQNKTGHTWNKYYTLLKFIYPDILKENNDFFRYSFISEINFQPSKVSLIKKFKAENRIEFLKSEYFKNFKVIILACGNYLDKKSIENIFSVKHEELNLSRKREKFEVFFGENRILLNTRQLSFDVSNEYLKRIADKVKNHIK